MNERCLPDIVMRQEYFCFFSSLLFSSLLFSSLLFSSLLFDSLRVASRRVLRAATNPSSNLLLPKAEQLLDPGRELCRGGDLAHDARAWVVAVLLELLKAHGGGADRDVDVLPWRVQDVARKREPRSESLGIVQVARDLEVRVARLGEHARVVEVRLGVALWREVLCADGDAGCPVCVGMGWVGKGGVGCWEIRERKRREGMRRPLTLTLTLTLLCPPLSAPNSQTLGKRWRFSKDLFLFPSKSDLWPPKKHALW